MSRSFAPERHSKGQPLSVQTQYINKKNTSKACPEIDHWVMQAWGVAPSFIDNKEKLSQISGDIVRFLELSYVSEHSHYFGPGVSTVIILSESHFSVHTWPEMGYIHIDLVTCEKMLRADKLKEAMETFFSPEEKSITHLAY